MDVQEVAFGGGWLLRIDAVEYTPAGDDELVGLAYLARAWRHDPLVPMRGGVSIPAAVLALGLGAPGRLERSP